MGEEENKIKQSYRKYLDWNHIYHWSNNVILNRRVKSGKPGLSDDCCLLPDGKTLYIEAKTLTGKRSESQIKFQAKCDENNVPYVIVRSAVELSNWFKTYFQDTEWRREFFYL